MSSIARGLALLVAFSLAPAASAKRLRDVTFLIRKGHHRDSNFGGLRAMKIQRTVDRAVAFKVFFTRSAAYRTRNPANQSDANKLMGITTANIHGTSIRLGWAWKPSSNKMTLSFYGYLKGRRVNEILTEVPLEQWIDVELKMHDGGLSARAGSARIEKSERLFRGLTTTWVLRTAYFGGDEKAPQDIRIQVKDIDVR